MTAAPPVVAETGWTPVRPLRIEGGRGSFVTGDPEGHTLRVAYFRCKGDRPLVGRAWFGPGSQGPPGHAHRGSMAAVLDECMGAVAWLAGHPVVAVHIEVDFQNMLPLGTDARFEAWVERVDGRKVHCRARLFPDGGEDDGGTGGAAGRTGGDFASSSGVFLILPEERFRVLLDEVARTMGTTPEGLRRQMRERAAERGFAAGGGGEGGGG